jgi:hypothetical protein
MKVVLAGAGDIKFHFNELLKINNEELDTHLNEIATVLKETNSTPVCLTDRGVLFNLVKKFKAAGGEKAIGLAPLSDNTFGITHMQEFIEAKVSGKKVFDEVIDTGDWYKQDMTHCLFGDVILMLGLTTGSLGELSYGYYLYKLIGGFKVGVEAKGKTIHERIIAGEKMPLHTIVYAPFTKDKLPFELEAYINKFGAKVFYVSNEKELNKVLNELSTPK